MKIRRAYLLAALTATTAALACTLNPQPLPPEEQSAAPEDAGSRASPDATPGANPTGPFSDAAAEAPENEGGGPNLEGDAAMPPDGDADGGDGGADASEEDGG